jgi:pyridoxal 5'-phosphate synthase pdxS subunit
MADDVHHLDKTALQRPSVCGCRTLEKLRRIKVEGASMFRTKGEAGTGNIVEAARSSRTHHVLGEIRRLKTHEQGRAFRCC